MYSKIISLDLSNRDINLYNYHHYITENYRNNHVTYLCTNEQIESNLDYFRRCMESGLSSYKALLFFNDYLEGDYLI